MLAPLPRIRELQFSPDRSPQDLILIRSIGLTITHFVRSSSNPHPHQKTMHPDLSRLVGLELLLRQLKTPQWFTIAGFFYDFRGVQFR